MSSCLFPLTGVVEVCLRWAIADDLAVEGVRGDGADEFVEVGGRGDASELRAGEGGAGLEAGAILGRKLESGGAELFKRMDVAAPEGDIALLLGAQALGVPLTR